MQRKTAPGGGGGGKAGGASGKKGGKKGSGGGGKAAAGPLASPGAAQRQVDVVRVYVETSLKTKLLVAVAPTATVAAVKGGPERRLLPAATPAYLLCLLCCQRPSARPAAL